MFCKILLQFSLVVLVQAQLNGEFWWMNSKLNNIKKIKPMPPKIDVSDFENEDSSKIIFRDDDLFNNKLKPIRDRTSKLMPNNNLNDNKVIWPTEEQYMKNHDVEVFTTQKVKEKKEVTKANKVQNKYDDVLVFSYPKNEKFVTIDSSRASTEPTYVSTTTIISSETTSSKINEYTSKLSTLSTDESQNICTYSTRNKCYQFNGFVYEYARRIPASSGDEPLICCILPIQPIINKNNSSHTVHFPRTSNLNRYKRSDTESIVALRQRDFLLKHKFLATRLNEKPTSTPITKIVIPSGDDYVDPYWNIKNTKHQTKKVNNKYTDYAEDSEEYTDELPKPGLIGLYSDHAPSPSNWPFANGNKEFGYGGSHDDYEDDDDEEDTFGYTAIDPRQGTKKQRQKIKPVKVTTTSDESIYDAERHTINFHSDPDFHVFQGFKLLNLFRNTSRVNSKKTSNQDTEVLVSAPEESEENVDVFAEVQLFDSCGKVATKEVFKRDKQIEEAPSGSHPWLALVVLTKSRHNVLCYATLIHPRAAITVADCTDGTAPGDVSVVSGLWDLNDKSLSKNRVATVHVHPRYTPDETENNLAVLHWMRPLKLNANIQPACLGYPQMGDECKFYGWGRLDQGIRQPRTRWQRATVRACSGRLSINQRTRKPGDPFCVSSSRGTVTGLGGPLICEIAGHSSVVGIVVSRDNGYVLSPVRDWAMKMDDLVSDD